MGSFSKAGDFKWMKSSDSKTSKGAGKAMKSTGKLLQNIAIHGKRKKAFKDFK